MQIARQVSAYVSCLFTCLLQFFSWLMSASGLGRIHPQHWQPHPYLTGKLCLQHEDLAKKCIAALARELEVSQDVAVRNNVVIVMCDLCVRYTTMVDRYIPNISLCLKDPHPFIRKQTLILITNLLQVNRGALLLCWALTKRLLLITWF